MKTTAGNIIRRARVTHLMDVDMSDFEFKDKVLIDALNNAIDYLLVFRPQLRWIDTHTRLEPEEFHVASASSEVNFPAEFIDALVFGVCSLVCKTLQSDEGMTRAGQMFDQQFVQMVRL